MKKITPFIAALLTANCILPTVAFTQSRDVPFTLEDRDRIMQTQKEVTSLRNEMNTRFESVNDKFESLHKEMNFRFGTMDNKFGAMDDKINKLYTLMYFVLGGVFGLIGFVIYDRRTALAPVTRDNRKLKEILYELAKTNPELKEILNKAAL